VRVPHQLLWGLPYIGAQLQLLGGRPGAKICGQKIRGHALPGGFGRTYVRILGNNLGNKKKTSFSPGRGALLSVGYEIRGDHNPGPAL